LSSSYKKRPPGKKQYGRTRRSHARLPIGRGVRIIRGKIYLDIGLWCSTKERAKENAEAFRREGFRAIIVPRKREGITGYSVYIG